MRRTMIGAALAVFVTAACSGSVLELDVGTCFDDPETFDEVEDVPVVDCSEPHDNEVIANEDLAGTDFPGAEQIERSASQICYDNFSDYVGIAYEDSIYDIGWLFPTEESWAVGDREVICFAYDLDLQKISGTVGGSGQ